MFKGLKLFVSIKYSIIVAIVDFSLTYKDNSNICC